MPPRRHLVWVLLVLMASSLATALGASGETVGGARIPGCVAARLPLVAKGHLTVGTDPDTVPPWWGGTPTAPWKSGYPPSGQGYESAVAYAIAKRLAVPRSAVKWAAVPAGRSVGPGKKPFDFYLAQVSFSPARARAVSFSKAYYPVEQAVVGLEARPITGARSVADLRPYKLGAVRGTSFSYITRYLKPSVRPFRYDTLDYAIAGLESGEIDGLVVDFPNANSITGEQRSHKILVGRLAARNPTDYFGLVLQHGSSLVTCVDKAIAAMKRDRTLARLEQQWLASRAPLMK